MQQLPGGDEGESASACMSFQVLPVPAGGRPRGAALIKWIIGFPRINHFMHPRDARRHAAPHRKYSVRHPLSPLTQRQPRRCRTAPYVHRGDVARKLL